jgi:hypothetical protein
MVQNNTMTEGYQLFVEELAEACRAYPTLSIYEDEKGKYLRGPFDIFDDDGKFWESYEIEIRFQKGFPKRFPKLFEVGGKIPKIPDWHVNPTDNSSCITVTPDEMLICRNGITVTSFILEYVRPHLANQTHRRQEGFYANGEYGHGQEGLWQFYENELGTKDKSEILRFLNIIANSTKPGKKSPCFCGSGQKYPKCHRDSYIRLSQLGKDYLFKEIQLLKGVLSLPPKRH